MRAECTLVGLRSRLVALYIKAVVHSRAIQDTVVLLEKGTMRREWRDVGG